MEEDANIVHVNKRTRQGAETVTTTFSIPKYLLDIIEEEAATKNKSRSNVITYLVYSGLKAHIGEFRYPSENTIKANWLKRGQMWQIKK